MKHKVWYEGMRILCTQVISEFVNRALKTVNKRQLSTQG